MYCSSCGVAVAQGLSYCNYCGAKLGGASSDGFNDSSELRPGSLLFAMMATFVFGLGAITLLMGMMKGVLNLSVGPIVAFTLLSFSIMLVLEGVFIRLLLTDKRGSNQAGSSALSKGQSTKELDAAHARELSEPVASVTEHTTRAFDPIYNERRSK